MFSSLFAFGEGEFPKIPHLARRSPKRGKFWGVGKSIRQLGFHSYYFWLSARSRILFYHAAFFHKGREKGFCVRAHDEGGAGKLAFILYTQSFFNDTPRLFLLGWPFSLYFWFRECIRVYSSNIIRVYARMLALLLE
ncbi:hypothetical protein KC335_g164 [Hortaea werneckii]|nr:hypothetical protein KC335_g164 [Hortaea werneckii]